MSAPLRALAPRFFGLCLAASVFTPATAFAGYVQVKDLAGVFTAETAERVRGHAEALPFDVRVVTIGTLGSRNAFDRFMNDQVVSPTMVVVGIDPTHRRTSVHYGRATGIAKEAYAPIERAGSAAFRAADYELGVRRILERAAAEAHPTAQASSPEAGAEPLALRWGLGAVVLFATAAGSYLLVALARRRETVAGPPP